MTALGTDPRFVEYRESREQAEAGAQRERYHAAIFPYLECLAEHANGSPISRKHLMREVFYRDRLPLAMILLAFRADDKERAFIEENPLTEESA